MLVQAPKFVPIRMEHRHTLRLLSVSMVLHRWGHDRLPAVVVVVKDASDAGAAAHFVWGCESGGVLSQYLLSLAGVPFNSGGISVCDSACIEPAVVNVLHVEGKVVIASAGGSSGAGGGSGGSIAVLLLSIRCSTSTASVAASASARSLCSSLRIPMGQLGMFVLCHQWEEVVVGTQLVLHCQRTAYHCKNFIAMLDFVSRTASSHGLSAHPRQ